ncbi:PepSY-like domain-containing protein [Flavisericum labens]|uniref:PepSY-like domain-containing protein n=1 Tax=Flavisericum labens TaxID=3377112 RepID=UPI00387B8D69
MKRIIGLLIVILFAKSTFAQKIHQNNVPAVILNAFQLKFPNAQESRWKLDDGNYKIDYEVNGKSHFLKMDSRGTVMQHNQDLYVSEIPKIVLETIRNKATYFDVHDADRYERDNRITYEIKFKVDGKYSYFWVNENGKLLKYRKELKDREVPRTIMSAITKIYGELDINYAKYVEEGNKIIYIIRGEINDSDHNFTFDHKVKLLKHTQDLKDSEIPAPIMKTIASNYPDHDIRDVDLKEENGKIIYILRLRNSKMQVYLTFNERGKVLEIK